MESTELLEIPDGFCTIWSNDYHDLNLRLAVCPRFDKDNDVPHFNVYNSKNYFDASECIMISFFNTYVLRYPDNLLNPKEITVEAKQIIIQYLESASMMYNSISVWNVNKYCWNVEYGFDVGRIDEYLQGLYDKNYQDNPNYVPSTITMPNYMEL